jgi:hypothetical protein
LQEWHRINESIIDLSKTDISDIKEEMLQEAFSASEKSDVNNINNNY